MFDQYEREDLGFMSMVSTLGEIVTDPGFKPGEWFVKHSDEKGIFIIPLDEELTYFKGDDPVWLQVTKAVFNDTETVVMLLKAEAIEEEWHTLTLLHSSVAHVYTTCADK